MNDFYTLTLRPDPSSVPPEVRLRRLLKIARRTFGFRCTSVKKLGTDSTELMLRESDLKPEPSSAAGNDDV